jgi:hypothetical protein
MWKASLRACIRPAALIGAMGAGLVLMFTIMISTVTAFHFMIVGLTFVGLTGTLLLGFPLVALLQAGGTLCTVKLGAEGGSGQIGRLSSEWRWRDVKDVQEREQSIVIELKAGLECKVPDRAFADAAARLKFLDDVRRWHELANAANTEHA